MASIEKPRREHRNRPSRRGRRKFFLLPASETAARRSALTGRFNSKTKVIASFALKPSAALALCPPVSPRANLAANIPPLQSIVDYGHRSALRISKHRTGHGETTKRNGGIIEHRSAATLSGPPFSSGIA
jgi:hypothetical protein